MLKKSSSAGFSLVELMVSVAIIGILAAVASPVLVKYVKRAKTTEARQMLQKIASGARVYYLDPQTVPGQIVPISAQFPDSELVTPALSCCFSGGARCAPLQAQWNTASWTALAFSMDDPHYYQYEFASAGTSVASTFTAMAYGDLDCDGTLSTYSYSGSVNGAGEVSNAANVARTNELE